MADAFLDGILGRSYEPVPIASPGCVTVQEITARLRDELALGSTPTRCSHIVATLGLSYNAKFFIPTDDRTSPDRNISSQADGTPAAVLESPKQPVTAPPVRKIEAQTVIDQQPDDPELQRLVAKHLVAAICEVDRSTWIMGDNSKSNEGWKITLACRDSMQEWVKRSSSSRAPRKVMVVENSQDHDLARQGERVSPAVQGLMLRLGFPIADGAHSWTSL